MRTSSVAGTRARTPSSRARPGIPEANWLHRCGDPGIRRDDGGQIRRRSGQLQVAASHAPPSASSLRPRTVRTVSGASRPRVAGRIPDRGDKEEHSEHGRWQPPATPGSPPAHTAPTPVTNGMDAIGTSPSRAEPSAGMPSATSPTKATSPTATPAPPTVSRAARSRSGRVARPPSWSSRRPSARRSGHGTMKISATTARTGEPDDASGHATPAGDQRARRGDGRQSRGDVPAPGRGVQIGVGRRCADTGGANPVGGTTGEMCRAGPPPGPLPA